MRIDIMTLFPQVVDAVMHESIIGRAAKKGIVEINCVQIRDYTDNKQQQVDDYPYGGGWGCVMMAQPLKACLDHIKEEAGELKRRVIYMSPQGRPYDQACARRLRDNYEHLVLVCGHYEGVDERFIEQCVDEEISLGDFVLTGGEIAAMAVADSVCRLVPGVLSDEQCYTGESHWDGLLEYPQYTRPELWEGQRVPELLLNGDHKKVEHWRRMKQLQRTMVKRPDMFERLSLDSPEDRELLKEARRDLSRMRLTEPISCRKSREEDLPLIAKIAEEAQASLKKHRVDQWQGAYPGPEDYLRDIQAGESYVVCHGGEIAAVFCLSAREDPNYASISDGKWSPGVDYCVIHRCAVGAKYRGSGMAKLMMDYAEELTRAQGRRSLRIDTHKKNLPMKNLLRECLYRYRGNIEVSAGPGHDSARQAYEKILKRRGGEE